ncbi:hypothetical protein E1B28_009535 [Marasmius oreades]|uniref:Cytochrome P450 n=1 Tax=Marasmius oreades TaxID=181124 RepID=A0A9P7RV94_9AGAR|nr:uncharacterized protein E1B28_009535 [Marasmius oreades]KAG7090416.1 hypothetical protein E1B28_009535 [Marasmius oreades]
MATSTSLTEGMLSSVLSGLTLHFLFQRLEKTQSLWLIQQLVIVTPLLPSYFFLGRFERWPWLWALLVGYTTCYTSLFTSILIYRLSPFHPLAQHPGPLLARCTKFWLVYHTYPGKIHLKYKELHRRYGPIVRTGPNELSICDVDAIPSVLGKDGMGKGPIWEVRKLPNSDEIAHIGMRNTTKHLQRRKLWNRAFATSSIKEYEPIMRNRLLQLLGNLDNEADKGRSVDLAKWMSYFAYDFMGDMAFGAGFELMRDGDTQGLWKIMEDGLLVFALTQHVVWLNKLLFSIPGMASVAASPAIKLQDFVFKTAAARRERGTALMGRDISTYLLDEGSPDPKPLNFDAYANEALLAIIAGSDSVASTLSCALYHLICDKANFSRLRAEIDDSFPIQNGQAPHEDPAKLMHMPFLNAVIDETLRLYSPVSTGLQRAPELGTGGKSVGSVFVPEDTPVVIPSYVIHRDPRYFSPRPEEYWPDRWITEDKNVETNRDAFIPFSTGPMNCVGKSLAQLELRAVISTLVQRYDMEFDREGNWTEQQWLDELLDFFVLVKGELPVVLKRRANSA